MVCMLPLFGLALVSVGLYWLATPWQTVQLVRRARHWASTEGETETAELESLTGGKYDRHYARITYRYEVAGEAFTGKEVSFGLVRHTLGAAEAVLDRYPARHDVTVWYDPNQPEHAVLERSCDWMNLGVNVALAGLVLGFGCLMIWAGATS